MTCDFVSSSSNRCRGLRCGPSPPRENSSCDTLADYPLAALALVLLGALLAALAGISVEYMYKEAGPVPV
jgi:hypothetical protein